MKLAKREAVSSQKVVGIDVFEILAVNPTIEQLNVIYQTEPKEDDKEIVYVDKKEGADRVKITIHVRGQHSKKLGRINFFIVDNNRKSKDGDKQQYVNQVCETSWADTEENLPNWFKSFYAKGDKNREKPIGSKSYRKAMEGEADFYEFVRAVMTGVNYFSSDSEVQFNFGKMLKGDFSEVNSYLTDPAWTSNFTAMWYVKNVQTEEGMKSYNEIFTRAILPKDYCAKIESATAKYYESRLEEIKSDEELFESLKIEGVLEILTPQDIYGYVPSPDVVVKNAYENKQIERFVKNIDGEYGCKGFYKIAPVFEYSESMDVTASDPEAAEDASSPGY